LNLTPKGFCKSVNINHLIVNFAYLVTLHKDLLATSSSQSEFGQKNDAFRISGALSYATHLLALISFYLGVYEPKRLSFG